MVAIMKNEWVYLGTFGAGTEDVRGRYRHAPCGTVLEIMQGYRAICPECQPEEWEERQRREEKL